MQFNEDLMKIIDACLKAGSTPMLLGEPGIGKSSWIEALGQRNGTKVFVLPCNQLADKADLTGARLVPVQGTSDYQMVFYPHEVVMSAIRYANDHPREDPILFMDELNRTTPDVTSACLSIPTMRKIGSVSLPKNLKVIVAGNDKGNITALDEASVSRFAMFRVTPDTKTFLGLDPNLNVWVKAVLEKYPDCIFGKEIHVAANQDNGKNASSPPDDDEDMINVILDDYEDTMKQFATPRTISGVSRWLNNLTQKDIQCMLMNTRKVNDEDVSLLQEALEGYTGKTKFTQYLLAEIADKIATSAPQANTFVMPKPQAYDEMKACTDRTALCKKIADMSETERSNVLVYLLQERADNKTYIEALAPEIKALDQKNMKTLMTLITTNQIDEENRETLAKCDCPLTQSLNIILTM